MSIRVSESASAHDGTLVHVTLSHHHNAAAAAPSSTSQARSESVSKSEALAFSASLEATRLADHRSSSAPTTAGKPAAESQTRTAPKQQPSTGAVSTVNMHLGAPKLPELPVMTSTDATAESLPSTMGSAPVSRVLGSALSQSWGLPRPWPLPSWRPAARPATTTAAMTAAIPVTPPTILDATTPASTPAATSAANALATTPAATSATPPAATEAQAIVDSLQMHEPSLADRAFQFHSASEALALPNAASPSTTVQASASNMSLDPTHAEELCSTCVSVPGSESAQPLQAAQQRHMPTSATDSRLPKHFRLSAAASLSLTPSAVTDADADTTAASQNGLRHHHDHPHLGPGSLTHLEEPSLERAAPEAALSAQDAAPGSTEDDCSEYDPIELPHFKPEQQALLAKGLQLCIQVHQVQPLPAPPPPPTPHPPAGVISLRALKFSLSR